MQDEGTPHEGKEVFFRLRGLSALILDLANDNREGRPTLFTR